jgi:hypothetical protein
VWGWGFWTPVPACVRRLDAGVLAPVSRRLRPRRPQSSMLRKLTVDQINDWFTIGKTVTNVELLGSPPAFPAEAPRDKASSVGPVAHIPAPASARASGPVLAPAQVSAVLPAEAPTQAPAPPPPAAAVGG